MANVMLLLRHRVSLVEELLEANVVDAQDVPADVEGFLVMREVGHVLSHEWCCMAKRNSLHGDG